MLLTFTVIYGQKTFKYYHKVLFLHSIIISETLYLINNKLLDIHQQQAAGKWND